MLSKGGRKFATVVAVFALSQGNLIAGLISEGTWERVLLGVALLYIGGNVAQKYLQNGNSHATLFRPPEQRQVGFGSPDPGDDPSDGDH